jgi:hypothetical protein
MRAVMLITIWVRELESNRLLTPVPKGDEA